MSKKDDNKSAKKFVAQNKKARFDYFIEDTVEAGIMLFGTEVKSLREGKASINESFAGAGEETLMLYNAYIPEYGQAGQFFQHETKRPRKLLLHKKELSKLLGAIQQKGVTIVPLSLYFNKRGIAKVELGLAKGKKQYDKRETEKQRDWDREKQRIMKDHNN